MEDIPRTSWEVEFLIYSEVFSSLSDKTRVNLHGMASQLEDPGLEPRGSEKVLGRTPSRLRTRDHRSHLK